MLPSCLQCPLSPLLQFVLLEIENPFSSDHVYHTTETSTLYGPSCTSRPAPGQALRTIVSEHALITRKWSGNHNSVCQLKLLAFREFNYRQIAKTFRSVSDQKIFGSDTQWLFSEIFFQCRTISIHISKKLRRRLQFS